MNLNDNSEGVKVKKGGIRSAEMTLYLLSKNVSYASYGKKRRFDGKNVTFAQIFLF